MGGRGSSSASGRYGLPNGARAITVTTRFGGQERETTYFQNEHGLLMMADATGTTIGKPVMQVGANIQSVYRNSVKNGLKFELLTSEQVNAANVAYRQNKESSYKDIAYAELHPQSGGAGLGAKRLLTTKTRAKGGRS